MIKCEEFVHLHVHTAYSLYKSTIRIGDLIAEVKRKGMKAIAITDVSNMFGVPDFCYAAEKEGIKPIIGCEVFVESDKKKKENSFYHLTLLVENEKGYQNLIKIVSLSNIKGINERPLVNKKLLRENHEGVICLSGCIEGEISQALLNESNEQAEQITLEYIDIFGKDNLFIELQNHGSEEDIISELVNIAEKFGLGIVATNSVQYLKREDAAVHDVLQHIRRNKMFNDDKTEQKLCDEYYLKSAEEMGKIFAEYPKAIANTVNIAERCVFKFKIKKYGLPVFPLPEGQTEESYLKQLCEERIKERYGLFTDELKKCLSDELIAIHKLGLERYFLILWDIVEYARKEGIKVGHSYGKIRGSLVAYILGIIDTSPIKNKNICDYFYKFEQAELPSVRLEFCAQRVNEITAYIRERYGAENVAYPGLFGTKYAKGALLEVGRVMNISFDEINEVVKMLGLGMTIEGAMWELPKLKNVYELKPDKRQLIDYAKRIEQLPFVHSGKVGCMIIAPEPLRNIMPMAVYSFSLDRFYVTQYGEKIVKKYGFMRIIISGHEDSFLMQE